MAEEKVNKCHKGWVSGCHKRWVSGCHKRWVSRCHKRWVSDCHKGLVSWCHKSQWEMWASALLTKNYKFYWVIFIANFKSQPYCFMFFLSKLHGKLNISHLPAQFDVKKFIFCDLFQIKSLSHKWRYARQNFLNVRCWNR